MINRYALLIIAVALLPQAGLRAQGVENPQRRAQVEASVNRGLDYLAETLTEQGCYEAKYGKTTAVPALAGMAFLSAGHIPGEGPYGDKINRIVDFIVNSVQTVQVGSTSNPGYFGKAENGRLYAHSIATLFLSEVSGMVDPERQKKINAVLPDAIRLLLDAQAVKKDEKNDGGWRYEPNAQDSDMSCSGWALMALRSAKLNGSPIPNRAIDRAVGYIKKSYNQNQGSFGYQNASGHEVTLTGAGILCLELCGRHNDEAAQKAVKYLAANFKQLENQERRFYGLYYTSQGLFQTGGETWLKFSEWMYDTWLPRQEKDGSWIHGDEDSTPYQTALCILAFTVPYRQLPIYQRDETVDE